MIKYRKYTEVDKVTARRIWRCLHTFSMRQKIVTQHLASKLIQCLHVKNATNTAFLVFLSFPSLLQNIFWIPKTGKMCLIIWLSLTNISSNCFIHYLGMISFFLLFERKKIFNKRIYSFCFFFPWGESVNKAIIIFKK